MKSIVDMKRLMIQAIKFGFVGLLSFAIDYTVLVFLTEIVGIWYLVSAFISYILSLLVNYFCSMQYVFKGKSNISKRKEFVIFVLLSVIGLMINQLGMFIMVDKATLNYLVSKLLITACVMVWNFVTRKLFLEETRRC